MILQGPIYHVVEDLDLVMAGFDVIVANLLINENEEAELRRHRMKKLQITYVIFNH